MSHGLAALTLPVVTREIDQVLQEDPEHPYHLAFAMPELRQKLIAHIINNIPNHYAIKETQQPFPNSHPYRLQERIWLEMVVRASILHVLRENFDWLRRHAL